MDNIYEKLKSKKKGIPQRNDTITRVWAIHARTCHNGAFWGKRGILAWSNTMLSGIYHRLLGFFGGFRFRISHISNVFVQTQRFSPRNFNSTTSSFFLVFIDSV